MVIVSNDLVTSDCQRVGNIPFSMLANVNGVLQVDNVNSGEQALNSLKAYYIQQFNSRLLTVCESNIPFCKQGQPFMVEIKDLELGCYTITTDPDGSNALAYTSKFSGIAKLAIDPEGVFWVVYTKNTTDLGLAGTSIYVAFSTNQGVSWQGHVRVNPTHGDAYSPSIAIDTDGLLHLVWRQNEYTVDGNIFQALDPNAVNVHYTTYPGGVDTLITDYPFNNGLDTLYTRSLTQYQPTIVIAPNGTRTIVWVGEGATEPQQDGRNWDTNLMKSVNSGPPILVYEYWLCDSVSAMYDLDGYLHIMFYAGNELRYIGGRGGASEMVTSWGSDSSFSLSSIVYGDGTTYYEPLVVTRDEFLNRNTPPMTAFQRSEAGWSSVVIAGTNGTFATMTGGQDPVTGDSSGPLTLTIPNHSITEGETVKIYWTGTQLRSYNNAFRANIIDESTIQLEGSEDVVNNFSGPGSWSIYGESFSVSRDAAGTVFVYYHDTSRPNEEELGNIWEVKQINGIWQTTRRIITEGNYWPSGIQLDKSWLEQEYYGYVFMNSHQGELRVCVDIQELNP